MGKKNYSQYFSAQHEEEKVEPTVQERGVVDTLEEEPVKVKDETIGNDQEPVKHAPNAVVTAQNGANMRCGTSTMSDVVCVLACDKEVYAENSNDPEWYYVETFTVTGEVDRIGFVMKKLIMVD